MECVFQKLNDIECTVGVYYVLLYRRVQKNESTLTPRNTFLPLWYVSYEQIENILPAPQYLVLSIVCLASPPLSARPEKIA